MPLCGFNQKMLDGLSAFNEGLVEHGLIERSKLKQRNAEDTLKTELSDMNKFLTETANLNDPKLRKIVEGLTIYAQGVYELIQETDVDKYKILARKLSNYFSKMDSKYYSELEGKPYRMKELVNYLNNQQI